MGKRVHCRHTALNFHKELKSSKQQEINFRKVKIRSLSCEKYQRLFLNLSVEINFFVGPLQRTIEMFRIYWRVVVMLIALFNCRTAQGSLHSAVLFLVPTCMRTCRETIDVQRKGYFN